MAKANLTSAGLALLTNAQGGNDTIVFTKMVIGDGKLEDTPISTLTALVSPKAEMPITQKKLVKTGTFQIGAYFSNTDIKVGFYWRETGIFAKGNDGKEILYCYVNVGDITDYISVATDKRIEKYIYQSLTVGNSTNISIEVNESEMLLTTADKGKAGGVAPLNDSGKVPDVYLPEMDYVETTTFNEFKENANSAIAEAKGAGTNAQSNLNSHTSNKSNPHGTTAAQVGALPITGGTLTDSLGVNGSYGRVSANQERTSIASFNVPNDTNNRRNLFLANSNSDKTLSDSLWFQDTISGKSQDYKIFGEHNKPTATYKGLGANQQQRTIDVGGIGNVLMVYCNTSKKLTFVTPIGGFEVDLLKGGNSALSLAPSYASFSNGVLNINSTSHLNTDTYEYTYQLL